MLKYKIPQIVTLTQKRSFISRAYKEKALQINDSQSLIEYSKRDLNPHSRNGQRILSPSCRQLRRSNTIAIYL